MSTLPEDKGGIWRYNNQQLHKSGHWKKVINTAFKWLGALSHNRWPGISCLCLDPPFWFLFLLHKRKICRVGVAGPSLQETHLSDAARMCALHGLNWKYPETHNSSGNPDVRQLPLGQGLGGQRIELHPHYPLVYMKRFMSWKKRSNHPQMGTTKTIRYAVLPMNRIGLALPSQLIRDNFSGE